MHECTANILDGHVFQEIREYNILEHFLCIYCLELLQVRHLVPGASPDLLALLVHQHDGSLTDLRGRHDIKNKHIVHILHTLLEVKLPKEHVYPSVCWLVGRSVRYNFLKRREVSLPCSIRYDSRNSPALHFVDLR